MSNQQVRKTISRDINGTLWEYDTYITNGEHVVVSVRLFEEPPECINIEVEKRALSMLKEKVGTQSCTVPLLNNLKCSGSVIQLVMEL